MRRLSRLAAALALLAAPAAHAQLGYASSTADQLFRIDFATGTATLIGPYVTSSFLEAIALSPSGTLYGTDIDGNLYTLNTTTGAATLVGNTGRGNIEGLDFLGNTLYGAQFSDPTAIFTIDLATAVTANVTPGGGALGSDVPRSLVILDATTALIPHGVELSRIDLATGAVTPVGTMGVQLFGLDFLSDGNLYGVTQDGLAYSVDPNTGAATQIFDTGDHYWLGLTGAGAATVPEPATVALLATGLLAVGALGRRQARQGKRGPASGR